MTTHNVLQRGQTTIASGSGGASLPQSTINVASTTGPPAFASSGTITVTTANGPQLVAYTGTSGTSFTGCTGGTGLMTTGGFVGDAWLNVQASELQTMLSRLAESINAVDGGCWAPVAPIPLKVWST